MSNIPLEKAAEIFGQAFCKHASTFPENDLRKVRANFHSWAIFQQKNFCGLDGAWMIQFVRDDCDGDPYNPLIMVQILLHKDMSYEEEKQYLQLTKKTYQKEMAKHGLEVVNHYRICGLPPFAYKPLLAIDCSLL